MRINYKAEAARYRRSMAELERLQREASEEEDLYWSQFEAPKSRAARKRQEESQKRAEAAARRAEARRFAEEEEKELDDAINKKKERNKVTAVELMRLREEEQAELARKVEEFERRRKRMVTEKEYESVVLVSNTNREFGIEASTIEEAIAQLTGQDYCYCPVDRVSEKQVDNGFIVRSLGHDLKLFRLGLVN